MTDIGHNSGDAASIDVLNSHSAIALRGFVDRLERLGEDLDAVKADIKEVMAEAKGSGFDTKILRKVLALRKIDRAKRQEEEALIDLYLSALFDE